MGFHPLASPEDGSVVKGGKIEVFVELGVVGEGDGGVYGAACEEEGEQRGGVAPGGGGDEVKGRAGEEVRGEGVERLGSWHAGRVARGSSKSPTNNKYISRNYTSPFDCRLPPSRRSPLRYPPPISCPPAFSLRILACWLQVRQTLDVTCTIIYPPLSNR